MNAKLVKALVVAGLAMAACSDDSDSSDTGGATSTSSSSDATETSAASSGGSGLDAAFGEDGILAVPLSDQSHDRFITVVEGADGMVYASGFVRTGEDTAASVTRFTAAGELDQGFGEGGTAVVNVAPDAGAVEVARGLVVNDDGSVVIATPFEKDPSASGDAAKDTDVALAKFDDRGTLDPSFGEDGVARIDFGPGKAVNADTFVGDNSWGLAARTGGYVVFGTTANAAADRTDADFVLAGVTEDGADDPAFGTDGRLTVDIDASGDNARSVKVTADGSILATGYSRDGDGVVSPVLIKADEAGVLDAAFGNGGVANHPVLEGVAESYQVGVQGDAYVMAGYGRGASSDEKVDLIVYRFTADGEWDQTFGQDGLFRLDLAGEDDRARNLVVLPDDRIMVVGSGKLNADEIDGLVVLLDADGQPVDSFGDGGHVLVDLGQVGDAFFGAAVSADASKVWLAGFSGATPDTDEHDDAVLARVAL